MYEELEVYAESVHKQARLKTQNLKSGELEDYIDESIGTFTDEPKPKFTVSNLEQADWAVRKIARIEAEREDAKAAAQTMITKITSWLEEEEQKATKNREYFDSLLEDYHRRMLIEDPKKKTIKLPNGKLKLYKQRRRWSYNEEVLLAWLNEYRPEWTYTPPVKVVPDKEKIKSGVGVDELGRVIDPETKNVIPGVEVFEEGLKFSVEVG